MFMYPPNWLTWLQVDSISKGLPIFLARLMQVRRTWVFEEQTLKMPCGSGNIFSLKI